MSIEDIPPKYQPAWYKQNLQVLKVEINMTPEEIKAIKASKNITKKPPIKVLDEDEEDPFKKSTAFQNPKETMWYDGFDSDDVEEEDIIDNNDKVDLEPIQIKTSISSIRDKLIQSKKPEQKNMFISPGEYVLFFNRVVVETGPLQKVKAVAEKIIIENENITDDDLVILLRVPLDKIFK